MDHCRDLNLGKVPVSAKKKAASTILREIRELGLHSEQVSDEIQQALVDLRTIELASFMYEVRAAVKSGIWNAHLGKFPTGQVLKAAK